VCDELVRHAFERQPVSVWQPDQQWTVALSGEALDAALVPLSVQASLSAQVSLRCSRWVSQRAWVSLQF
jgi:hypothetical protein